jgi:hypothetical protein
MPKSFSTPLHSVMAIPPTSIDIALDYLAIGSALCGAIGSGTALGVDFLRRRVRAKAAEYAASSDFKLLREDLIETHGDLQEFIKEYRGDRLKIQENHLDICQRVTRLEAKIHD